MKFGGADVPAGTYGLFSIPGETEWTVILSKNSTQWGAFTYDQKDDFVRVTTMPADRFGRLAPPTPTGSSSPDSVGLTSTAAVELIAE